ncbi:MAG: 4-hydroxy-tetrahydrodipicolinate reductase [Candidatus Methanomethylophilaceae archaeon]
MVNVVVAGATGRLGRMVCGLMAASDDLRLTGAVVSLDGSNVGKEIAPGVRAVAPSDLDAAMEGADVYVDLTSPEAASGIIDRIPAYGVDIVLGTTAVDGDVMERFGAEVASNKVSAIVASNFSLGISAFRKACAIVAELLPDYDIEVVEAHHASKADSPSGTADDLVRMLQDVSGIGDVRYGRRGQDARRGREIGVHSVRAGDIVGDHTVIFAGDMERIELKHSAISREVFAHGCIRAIRWVAGRKDGRLHSMEEVLEA